MPNAWLEIPLDDYEAHMRSEAVQQLDALSELFRQVLQFCKPESVAILGIAGGNGLEHVDPAITRRILGLDINPTYLEAVRQRYIGLRGLELCCVDLTDRLIGLAPVELVHAALLFEHTGLGPCLRNALSLVSAGGRFSVILQLSSPASEEVTATPFQAIKMLRSSFHLIDPAYISERVEQSGFQPLKTWQHPLPSGKAFWTGIWKRSGSRG